MFHIHISRSSLLKGSTDLILRQRTPLLSSITSGILSDRLAHPINESSTTIGLCFLQYRTFKRILKKIQSPEEKAELPVYQYASDSTSTKKRVYVWGLAQTGALCKPEYILPDRGRRMINVVNKPARLEFAHYYDVVDAACGSGFTILAVKSKDSEKVFGCGINTDCQVGYHCHREGRPLGIVGNPCPIDIPFNEPSTAKVQQVACGRAHTAVLTSEGVYTFGNNSYGQCGRSIVEDQDYGKYLRVHRITEIDGIVKQIVCGQDHTLFLMESGMVYSCGLAADGQTGVGHYKTNHSPTRVIGDIEGVKIIYLACRADTVLAISDKGDLFGWGNSEYKQLSQTGSDSQQLNVSKHLKLGLGRILHAAASGSMCAVVDEKGQVWVWGYGILGQGPKAHQSVVPTLIPSPVFGQSEFNPDTKVERVYAGMNCLGAITNQNDLYMWGLNKFGCLGLGFKHDQFFPYRVSLPAKALSVSCGVDHTVALCKPFV